VSEDQVKTFKFEPINSAVAEARVLIAAAATASEVRIVSIEEEHGRLRTKLTVTVAGHPRQIRAFDHEVHPDGVTPGGSGGLEDLAFAIAMDFVVRPAINAAQEQWRRRRDPPFPGTSTPGPGEARTTVSWKWEQVLPDGDAVGPVVVCSYLDCVRGHEILPVGGHRNSPLAAANSPHGRP
jgi:hypothetical protein